MNRIVNTLAGRMSLRDPQRESLEILARVMEIAQPHKHPDLALTLKVIRSEFSHVEDFEREFASLTFALATGVGKTRLMGAFIAFLKQEYDIRHFFVLAPNLTIYEKLKADFTPNTPKYVFQGISEFASNPPLLVTGENFEDGRGARTDRLFGDVIINVFNVAKINTDVSKGAKSRIRNAGREVIGGGYYDHLASLDDLVILMDESHRYRAKSGMKAINDLKPILGLELTATPKGTGAGGVAFKNVIYSFSLSEAMNKGYVKEPAVATRENFKVGDYTDEQLDRLKLEDGIHIHEATKVKLEVYGLNNDKPVVKPFVLVVAQNIEHAKKLEEIIKSGEFFEARYASKVIRVDSQQSGALADETLERLLRVERPDEATEIVIHVNKLGEGWDVTNLYTIVPLRASKSDILTEQTIGRGLRLPYGKRTGVEEIDQLNIVAHDQFEAIVNEAKNPNSIIKKGYIIRPEVMDGKKVAITVTPAIFSAVTGEASSVEGAKPIQKPLVFATPEEKQVATATLEAVRHFEALPSSTYLKQPEQKAKLVRLVKETMAAYKATQPVLEGILETAPVDVEKVVDSVVEKLIELTIDIPKIVITPVGEVTCGFRDFDLKTTSINFQPVSGDILIEGLVDGNRRKMQGSNSGNLEPRLEDYIVRVLMDFPDVDYDQHSELLYKLAGQATGKVSSYLSRPEDIENVLRHHHRPIAELIHAQMQEHYWEESVGYEARVTKGFETLRSNSFDGSKSERARDFKAPIENASQIRSMYFSGFAKCLYPVQQFHSDAERRLAVVLENDTSVQKWFKPAPNQFPVYLKNGRYEPDFVVETNDAKLVIEVKQDDKVTDEEVLAKAKAAKEWCAYASQHEADHGGKPWTYLLLPDTGITLMSNIQGLIASYAGA